MGPLLGWAALCAVREARGAEEDARIASLRDRLEEGVLGEVPGAMRNGTLDHRLPGTSNLSFPGLEAEALALRLDLEGFAVSVGSACSSGSAEPSHVLRAMELPPERVASAVRFSLGWASEAPEVDALVERLPALVAELRALHPVG